MDINAVTGRNLQQKIASKESPNTDYAEKVQATEAEKAEAFKKEVWNGIASMPWNGSMNISIQITDKAMERMRTDPEFKDKMMSILREESIAAKPPGNVSLVWIDENGYRGYSYLQGGEENFRSHSKHKDAFFTKKADKKETADKIWEEQQLKRKLERKRLDEEYEESLFETRARLRKEEIAELYEKQTIQTN